MSYFPARFIRTVSAFSSFQYQQLASVWAQLRAGVGILLLEPHSLILMYLINTDSATIY